MEDPRYTEEDEKNAREAAEVLKKYAAAMEKFMQPHGIATAFLSVGLSYAMRALPAADAANWLRNVANEIESGGDNLQDNWPLH